MCSIGRALGTEARCSGKRRTPLDIGAEQIELLCLRTGYQYNSRMTVCVSHFRTFVTAYSANFKVCCNPFHLHGNNVKGRLQEVSLAEYKLWQPLNLTILPGNKLCYICKKEVKSRFEVIPQDDDNVGGAAEDNQDDEGVAGNIQGDIVPQVVLCNKSTQTEMTEVNEVFCNRSTQTTETNQPVGRLRARSEPQHGTGTTSRASSRDGSPFPLSGQSAQSDASYKSEEILESINEILIKLKVGCVDVKKLRRQTYYGIEKLEEVTDAFKSVMIQAAEKTHDY